MSTMLDGATLARAHRALNARGVGTRAFWVYDLDAIRERAAGLKHHLKSLSPRLSYALKANGLPAIGRALCEAGYGADAGSLGELELARSCGFTASARTLSGNGRTPEEAAWAARHGVEAVSADAPDELGLLERAMADAGSRCHVALRVNPGHRRRRTPRHRDRAFRHQVRHERGAGDGGVARARALAPPRAGWRPRARGLAGGGRGRVHRRR
jgi:diaminopimelate decarboxylase